ncbi:MAG TPA: hypothetical protein VMS31_14820, partial [Pyrinomonadaceae bacterium]|nr:hypothetical protein [Pyrinomonadaceae bacterium]
TVGFAGRDIQKKGLVPGAAHVGLDLTPVVGTAKNIVEIFTGDLIPDKPPKTPPALVPSPAGASPPSQPESPSNLYGRSHVKGPSSKN